MSDSSSGNEGRRAHTAGGPLQHVLIVDDSLTVRMAVRALFHEAGFRVTACETRAAAGAALRKRRYDLAVLDVLLPDGTGLDILCELRGLYGEESRVPVIFLSTEAEISHRMKGLRIGADAYFGKPFNPGALLRRAFMLLPATDTALPEPASRDAEKILLVDDSAAYRRRLGDALGAEGYEVILAASAEEALSFLAIDGVALVVIDAKMPGMGGLELSRRIRASPRHYRTPLLAMVGSREDVKECLHFLGAGVNAVVDRDPDLAMVRQSIRDVLTSGRALQQQDPPSSRRAGFTRR